MKKLLLVALSVLLALGCVRPLQPTLTPSPTLTPIAIPTPRATATAATSPTTTPATATSPTATATGTPTPIAVAPPPPPVRDMYALAERLRVKSDKPIPRVVNPYPVSYDEGRKDTFYVVNIMTRQVRRVTATLKVVSPHAYWYADDAISLRLDALKESARAFEQEIYPRVTAVFGTEWVPGVDNDVHLTILHTPLQGLAGYYSSADEYPIQVHPLSNQREMIYLDSNNLTPGTRGYLGTLAHEFTHAIQFRANPTEETWVNEGLAEIGKEVAGYPLTFQNAFLASPSISLTLWPASPDASVPHYGGASLFFDYLASQFGGASVLRFLEEEPADGIAGVETFLRRIGAKRTFREVFADWVVANYLDDSRGGPYGYPSRDVRVTASDVLTAPGTVRGEAPQYGARYYDLQFADPQVTLTFRGQPFTPLFPDPIPDGGHCWWSNQGDSIDSTLTGRFTLPTVGKSTLSYDLWYDVEDGWDYVYVEASTDGGSTWDILPGELSSMADPVGNAFGPGYTGSSNGWRHDQVDLGRYAGKELLLRFEYVTDDAINGPGLCLDRLSLPAVGFLDDGEQETGFWEAKGFIRMENRVPQSYIVRVIEMSDPPSVRTIDLDARQQATFAVQGFRSRFQRAVLVVAPTADFTALPASFQVETVVGLPASPAR